MATVPAGVHATDVAAGAPLGQPASTSERNWIYPGRDLANTRFSPVATINADNVTGLREVWSYSTGVDDGHEGQPIVHGDRMWVITPYPNHLIAFDISDPQHPRKLWQFTPEQNGAAYGKACCDRVNRGGFWHDGKIYYNALDNTTWAINAETGRAVWKRQLGDVDRGETRTMAPILAGNKVIIGNSGGDLGVRGWIAALDDRTGNVVWQAYSTGDDASVRIGDAFRAPYAALRGKNLGTTTWPGDQWQHGGGNAWGWVSYDEKLKLLYYGTANPGVWNPDMREGSNLWSAAVIARDADTGMARWAYQFTPHDEWDYDGTNEMILADLRMPGAAGARPVLVHFDRNGFAYTIDRTTGEVLVASSYVFQNWAKEVDARTGRVTKAPEKQVHEGRTTTNICPSSLGGRDQQPAAYSPSTGYFYTGTINVCMDMGAMQAEYIAGTPYLGAEVKMFAGPGGHQGTFLAWDATRGRKVWEVNERFPVWSGVLATAGNVVFYGTMDGDFKALDARDGRLLWRQHFDSGIVGNPVTYVGRDGKQYVAVYSGVGGWYGGVVPGKVSVDDPYAGLGVMGAAAPLKKATKAGGSVHIFALP